MSLAKPGFAVLFSLLYLLSPSADAAPSLVGVEGDVGHGMTLVVTGVGFGDRESQTPAVWDAVENIAGYSGLANGAAIPVGADYPWQTNSYNNPGSMKYFQGDPRWAGDTAHYRTSNYRGYLQWPTGLGGTRPGSGADTLYVSFWVKPEGDLNVPNHSSKFLRIWDDFNGAGSKISWTQMHMTTNSGPGPSEVVNWGGWGGTAGKWSRLEMLVEVKAGRVRTWTDGKLTHDMTNFIKSGFPGTMDQSMTIARVGWDAGGVSPPSVDVQFDDIYADISQARVELCNQARWSDCGGSKEIQIPKQWTSSSIEFEVNLGALDSDAELYLYVVDSTGAVNANGYPIGAVRPGAPLNFN